MSNLEKIITEAALSGRLTAITVWPTSGGFQCNVRRKTHDGKEGWSCVTDADPVLGLKQALGAEINTDVIHEVTPKDKLSLTKQSKVADTVKDNMSKDAEDVFG